MNAATLVRRLFALPERNESLPPVPAAVIDAAWPGPGEITLITGGSGGGKSRLLAAMRERGQLMAAGGAAVLWIEPGQLPLGDTCVVDRVCDELDGTGVARTGEHATPNVPSPPHAASNGPAAAEPLVQTTSVATGHAPVTEAHIEAVLELLSRVGLAEAWTYLQKPCELSDGQRWRLLLALAVARAVRQASPATGPSAGVIGQPVVMPIIVIDEFAALLDRVTARIVARALRRLVDRPGGPRLAAIVATSHDDLRLALSPDRQVTADFGAYRAADGSIAVAQVVKRRKRRRVQ